MGWCELGPGRKGLNLESAALFSCKDIVHCWSALGIPTSWQVDMQNSTHKDYAARVRNLPLLASEVDAKHIIFFCKINFACAAPAGQVVRLSTSGLWMVPSPSRRS